MDSLPTLQVPIFIQRPPQNSLNNRFRESQYITTECTLAIDDDMLYNPKDIEFGYQVWKDLGQGRKRMVGYQPRGAAADGAYLTGDREYR